MNVVAVDLSIQLENLAYKVQKTPGGRSLRRLVFPPARTIDKIASSITRW